MTLFSQEGRKEEEGRAHATTCMFNGCPVGVWGLSEGRSGGNLYVEMVIGGV